MPENSPVPLPLPLPLPCGQRDLLERALPSNPALESICIVNGRALMPENHPADSARAGPPAIHADAVSRTAAMRISLVFNFNGPGTGYSGILRFPYYTDFR